ncbi:hypothetical protein N7457_000878 [Penicillium paradoxum]|uniref:uncharacterized protein n=1 Tax=Penicillium paradoxum TaxID=176176 RepID=UPI002548A58B|nr:uncharacterized protein N7457_000878 [Penicillium paradoxum]KAJ5794279.1 hypothetical protein N7457_000878 [Penicillium paradoxum]
MAPSEKAWIHPIPPLGVPAATPDVPPASSTPARRYGDLQDEGAVRQQWIEDPTDNTCHIRPTGLTVQDLQDTNWYIQTHKKSIPFTVADDAVALGYSDQQIYPQTLARKTGQGAVGRPGKENIYDVLVGKGVIIAEAMFRRDGPQFSEIAKAFLQEVAEPQSLRHFYVCDIINYKTRRFVHRTLYSSRNNLEWPSRCGSPLIWQYNTPEYQGILGTPIGKSAAYLVLEIFPRGTHYIARIVTWNCACLLQMRFDIEPIPTPLVAV